MYKFKEDIILDDVKSYIDKTYSSHYSSTKKQATEIIIDQGHGEGFCMGNILKYAQRYGKKDGKNKNDLMKVIHYAVIQLSQDHYQQENLLKNLQQDLLQYDIGKHEEPALRSVMSEKYNKENI
jgi:hypothetical protein